MRFHIAALLGASCLLAGAPGYADLFNGLRIGDSTLDLARLGDRASEVQNDDGSTVAEFRGDRGQHVIVSYSADDRVIALHATADDGTGAIRLGQTSVTELVAMASAPDQRIESQMPMVPVDGQWTWRVLFRPNDEANTLMLLAFAADAFDADQPTIVVPMDARLISLTLLDAAQAAELLPTLPDTPLGPPPLGRAILELATQ
ncbi:hypothetical protein V8J82_17795 [Gymnodinialimonas sp. 2305UL16-5]|uniref:hypothetical protein n=1 Tax=Gymnodinialimonas mytili TaxID=3126503 RepID=UPI00309DF555